MNAQRVSYKHLRIPVLFVLNSLSNYLLCFFPHIRTLIVDLHDYTSTSQSLVVVSIRYGYLTPQLYEVDRSLVKTERSEYQRRKHLPFFSYRRTPPFFQYFNLIFLVSSSIFLYLPTRSIVSQTFSLLEPPVSVLTVLIVSVLLFSVMPQTTFFHLW